MRSGGVQVTWSSCSDCVRCVGYRQCCDLLQEAGCDVDEEDNEGHSPQMLGVLGGADFLLFSDENTLSIEELNKAILEAEEQKEQELELQRHKTAEAVLKHATFSLSASQYIYARTRTHTRTHNACIHACIHA